MEFDYIGSHCEVSTCKLQDFLPFSCDICKGTYCLNHRSYSMHHCEGQYIKDINSIECPICHLTVKYNKSEDINEIWTTHYNTNCKVPELKKKMNKCFETSCNKVLGLSNKYTCNKCNKDVCLSHRALEDHHCSSIVSKKTKFIDNTSVKSSNNKVTLKNNDSNISASIPLKNEAFLSRFSTENSKIKPNSTIKNSRTPIVSNSSQSQEVCPMCYAKFVDANELINHFDKYHNDDNVGNVKVINSSSNNDVRIDNNCPYCNVCIEDPVELVNHVENHNNITTNTINKSSECAIA